MKGHPGHDPASGSAAPRVSAEVRSRDRSARRRAEHLGGARSARRVKSLPRVQPDARPPRLRVWGISFPEIYRMQVKAIMEAACRAHPRTKDFKIRARDHDPVHRRECEELRIVARRRTRSKFAKRSWARRNIKIPYSVGTMIEIPRAALIAAIRSPGRPSSSRSAPTTSPR